MARFTYRCEEAHYTETHAPLGQAEPSIMCPACKAPARRHFSMDSMPQIVAMDPFRAYDLSPRKEQAAQKQKRPIDAPRDRFEAKRMERDLGRVYIGDDTSGMSKGARRGIEVAKEKAE